MNLKFSFSTLRIIVHTYIFTKEKIVKRGTVYIIKANYCQKKIALELEWSKVCNLLKTSVQQEEAFKVWSRAYNVQKLGVDWIKHLMDIARSKMNIQKSVQQKWYFWDHDERKCLLNGKLLEKCVVRKVCVQDYPRLKNKHFTH